MAATEAGRDDRREAWSRIRLALLRDPDDIGRGATRGHGGRTQKTGKRRALPAVEGGSAPMVQAARGIRMEPREKDPPHERIEEPSHETPKGMERREQALRESEEDRQLAEEQRLTAEELRKHAEILRDAAEQVREAAESARLSAEENRRKAEQAREASEAVRVATEEIRQAAEALREVGEKQRASAEEQRLILTEILATLRAQAVTRRRG